MFDSNRPIPAAIDGRRWAVEPSPGDLSGATDTKKARLFAPISDTPTGRMVRNHELAHAKITPALAAGTLTKRHGITMEALQWSEDSRISTFLDRNMLVDDDAMTDTEADAIARVCGGSIRGIAGALLVNWSLDSQRARLEGAFIRAGIPAIDLQGISDRVETIRDGIVTKARGARRRGRRKSWASVYADRRGFNTFTVPLAKAFDAEFPEGGTGDNGQKRGEPDRAIERKLAAVPGSKNWGRITDVFRPKLDRAVRPPRSPGKRFSDTGVIPTAVHRITTDGAVFTTRRKVKGGTVLCDASGSMHYSDADIERILQEAPGSTVAFYAGSNCGSPRGRIVVAADRGRATTVQEVRRAMPGQENLIDGPALRWLARQPAPRFWISDEGVGGVHDFGPGGPCHRECIEICKAAHITIVRRIEDLRR